MKPPKRLKTLQQIMNYALKKRALYSPGCMGGKQMPAAFWISMQGRTLLFALTRGLYVYEKKGAK